MHQIITGIRFSGLASLVLLAYIYSTQNHHKISKRSIDLDDEIYEYQEQNSTSEKDQWISFLNDINLDISQDVYEKVAQVAYTGNFNNMRQYFKGKYAQVHDAMLTENDKRMTEASEWADAIKINLPQAAEYKAAAGQSGNCEWSISESLADEDGCVKRIGLEFTSPHITKQIQNAGCDDPNYVPYTNDDNTNVWFIVPRAIPLWAKDENSHIDDWAEYFTLIKRMTANWWVRKHTGLIRLSVGLYLNGVQMIPRGVKMSLRNPLTRLTRWYRSPSISAARPGFYKTLKSVSSSLGTGIYKPNSANGVLPSTEENKDNCYMLMFIQDIPYDLNTIHVRTGSESRKRTGDFFDKINSVCTANYAFVMPGARDPESKAGKFIDQFEMIAFPNRKTYFPYDPDFSGIYRLENFQEVSSQAFEDHLRMGMCMHSKRQQCKLSQKGRLVDQEVVEYDMEYYAGDEYGNDYYGEYTSDSDNDALVYGYEDDDVLNDMKSIEEEITPEPQCCGGNIYGGHFNNAIKSCNFEGKIVEKGKELDYDYDQYYQ